MHTVRHAHGYAKDCSIPQKLRRCRVSGIHEPLQKPFEKIGRHCLSWVLPTDQPELTLSRSKREHVHVTTVKSIDEMECDLTATFASRDKAEAVARQSTVRDTPSILWMPPVNTLVQSATSESNLGCQGRQRQQRRSGWVAGPGTNRSERNRKYAALRVK